LCQIQLRGLENKDRILCSDFCSIDCNLELWQSG
jgi:hypothetical protein